MITFLVLFGVFFDQIETIYRTDDFVVQRSVWPQRVLASSVGTIVTADGDYSIVNDGVTYRTNVLHHGDNILLSSGTHLTFTVDGHQAYIVGPWSVDIEVEDGWYRFVVREGDFFEVFSSHNDGGTKLTIEMDDVVVAHDAQESTMKIQMAQHGSWSVTIKNYADTVQVSSTRDVSKKRDVSKDVQLTIADDDVDNAVASSFDVTKVAFFAQTTEEVVEIAHSLAQEKSQDLSAAREDAPTSIAPATELSVDVVGAWAEVASMSSVGGVDVVTSNKRIPSDELLAAIFSLSQVAKPTNIADVSWARNSFATVAGCGSYDDTYEKYTWLVSVCVTSLSRDYHLPPSSQQYLDGFVAMISTMSPPTTGAIITTGSVVSTGSVVTTGSSQ